MASPDRVRLVVLFGGRSAEHEVSCTSAADVLAAVDPERYDVVPVGITRDGEWVQADDALAALAHGRAALPSRLVASGTASLEAALLKRPMVITYRIGPWQYKLMKRLAYLPWIGLPNILCNETVVPELLQDEATPDRLAAALERWLDDAPARAALHERFVALHLSLRQDTAAKAAAAILPYLQGRAAA